MIVVKIGNEGGSPRGRLLPTLDYFSIMLMAFVRPFSWKFYIILSHIYYTEDGVLLMIRNVFRIGLFLVLLLLVNAMPVVTSENIPQQNSHNLLIPKFL